MAAVDWAELPRDLIQLIFEKLVHISEQCQFGRVCPSWRTLALEHRRRCFPANIPGLLIPGQNCNTSCKTRRFLPLPVGKEIIDHHNTDDQNHIQNHQQLSNLPLLPIPHLNLCRGSFEDWLVMVENNMSMYLFNPFSGARIDLPPVTAIPKSHPLDTPSKWNVNKVILSTSPSSSSSTEDCIVVVFDLRGTLAFYKIGEKKIWSVFESRHHPDYFVDGIYYKGSFIFVNWYGQVYICNDIMSTMQPKITKFDAAMPPNSAAPSDVVSKWYLVKSSTGGGGGDLLLIWRDTDLGEEDEDGDLMCSNDAHVDAEENDNDEEGNYNENDENDIEADEEFDHDNDYIGYVATFVENTTSFTVFKLDTASGSTSPTWLEVNNLDGEALFLGLNQSFSLSESYLQAYQAASCYRGDRIYFTDDNILGHQLHLLSGNDMGIYNLEDSTVEPLYLIDSDSTKPPAVWVTPKPWSWPRP